MKIRQATIEQYNDVVAFYYFVIDSLKNSSYDLGWRKEVYPTSDYLLNSVKKDEMFIAIDKGKIISAMVMNHDCNDSYREYEWPTLVRDDDVTIIHLLCVHPELARKGIGRQMVQFAIDTSKRKNQKVIRLDVLKGNYPAENLYTSMGFRKLHTLQMFYENTGWTEFDLFEYIL